MLGIWSPSKDYDLLGKIESSCEMFKKPYRHHSFFVGWWLVVLEEVSFINSGSQTRYHFPLSIFFQQLPLILDVFNDELSRIAICGIFLTSFRGIEQANPNNFPNAFMIIYDRKLHPSKRGSSLEPPGAGRFPGTAHHHCAGARQLHHRKCREAGVAGIRRGRISNPWDSNHHCLPKGFNHRNWVSHYFNGGGSPG